MKGSYDYHEVVVIGAGPSGLAAGIALSEHQVDFCILDAGKPLEKRSHKFSSDLLQGEGGAGLFSDGKFSFYPSATALWELHEIDILKKAYIWLSNIAKEVNLYLPDFPQIPTENNSNQGINYEKKYPSFCIEFDQRKKLILSLRNKFHDNIYYQSNVIAICRANDLYNIYVENITETYIIKAKYIIFSGGRFGIINLKRMLPTLALKFRRFEIGIRLEQPHDTWIFNNYKSKDIKIIEKKENIEWRTFCTCRQGRILQTNWYGLQTFSGTTDFDRTNFSNIGLNLRFNALPTDQGILSEILDLLSAKINPFSVELENYLGSQTFFLGEMLDKIFKHKLIQFTKNKNIKTKIYGPCIEGIGYYPKIASTLKTENQDIYITGDATGLFRGLTAALLSGFYCGEIISNTLKDISNIYIKKSSSEPLPIIFTAQSKEFFYCRDVICEYVIKQKKIPINPFRVFDYFLGDRVDRNLIRQSNNQLLAIADEVWVFGLISDGVLFEIYRAHQLKKPVRLFTIGTTIDEIKEIPIEKVKFDPEIHSRGTRRESLLALLKDTVKKITPYQLRFPNAK